MEPMTLHKAERYSEDHHDGKGEFIAFFPSGPKNCCWLDAYMGLFRIEGIEGFVTTRAAEDHWPDLQVIPLEGSTGVFE